MRQPSVPVTIWSCVQQLESGREGGLLIAWLAKTLPRFFVESLPVGECNEPDMSLFDPCRYGTPPV